MKFIGRLDSFILDRVFTPVVYTIDKYLYLNQYKQAFWCFQASALGLVVRLAQRITQHKADWTDYTLVPLLLLLYVWMCGICRECSKDYESRPYALPRRATFFLRNTTGRMFFLFWGLINIAVPPYTDVVADFASLCFFLYTAAFYIGAVTQPNTPRFEWSKLFQKVAHAS